MAYFHNQNMFDMFFLRVHEFFAKTKISNNVRPGLSLFDGLKWVADKYIDESAETKLSESLLVLENWISREVQFGFFCPDVDHQIDFMLSNKNLIAFYANSTKHHLLRLSGLLRHLRALCESRAVRFSQAELLLILAAMMEELRSRLEYHSTRIIEMLGRIFFALNNLIKARYSLSPTMYVNQLVFPAGISSDVFRSIYGDLLIMRRYSDNRILDCTPATTRWLKLRY